MVDIGLKPLFSRLTTPRAMVVRMPTSEGHLGPSTVKVVSINHDDLLSLVYKEVWVGEDEDVQVGGQHTFRIIDIGEVTQEEDSNHLNIKKLNGDMFMQLQMETSEDVHVWMQGLAVLKQLTTSTAEEYDAARAERDENLLALMSLRENIDQMQQRLADVQQDRTDDEPSGEPEDENDEEPHEEPELNPPPLVNEQPLPQTAAEEKILHQARQIEHLIQANKQKEHTVQKLTQRLEHSLEMLKAVHEMYEQQKNVLQRQQRVIEELRAERADHRAAYIGRHSVPESASFPRPQNAPAPSVLPNPKMLLHGQMNGAKQASMEGTARQCLEKMQEQDTVPRFQDLVNIEKMIGANGEPALDSMDDLLTLLKQLEVLKNSIDTFDQMTEATAGLSESPKVEEVTGSNVSPKPTPKGAHSAGGGEAVDELEFLGENLRSLEAEKQSMQNQLRAAQNEQEEMVQRLTEMKAMMEALGKLQT